MDPCTIMDNCDNNRVILIDTSFCVSLFRGVCWHVKEMALPENRRAASLLEFAQGFFHAVSKCCARDNKIYCPESVYNNEVDPENPSSRISWEASIVPWGDIFANKDKMFFSELGKVLNDSIETPSLAYGSLNKDELHKYGLEDSEIFELARQKNIVCKGETIVLTDDDALWRHIVGLNLEKAIPMDSPLFLRTCYICCKLRSDEYKSFHRAYQVNWIGRIVDSPGLCDIYKNRAVQAAKDLGEAIKIKHERSETREEPPFEIDAIRNVFIKEEGRENE